MYIQTTTGKKASDFYTLLIQSFTWRKVFTHGLQFVWMSMLQRITIQHPYLVGTVVHVVESNNLSNVPYLVGRVVRVMENNELSLLMFHIWSNLV